MSVEIGGLTEQDQEHIQSALSGGSAHKTLMACIILQEWAKEVDSINPDSSQVLGETHQDTKEELVPLLMKLIDSPPRDTYSEMTTILQRIQLDCQSLLSAFASEGKVAKKLIPSLPTRVDPTSSSSDCFTLSTAQQAATTHFDALMGQISKNTVKQASPGLKDRQMKVIASIGFFAVMKERYDTQVAAGVAGALVALRVLPAKFGGLIKAIMDSIKVS